MLDESGYPLSKGREMIFIGTGILNWNRYERVSDRYGVVRLYVNETSEYSCLERLTLPTYGKLVAEVIETRESDHIGDVFRGFFPSIPEVGDKIVLGEGVPFYEEDQENGLGIGLNPRDRRDNFWLNPESLYRCHSQTVSLYLEEV